jgi:N-acetylmuramoyl-L-alanine amidase
VTSPAVLIEGGFITNKDELSKLVSEEYRDQLAAAVTDGVLRYRDALSQRKSAVAATAQKSTE